MMANENHDAIPQQHAPCMQVLAFRLSMEVLVVEYASVNALLRLRFCELPKLVQLGSTGLPLGLDDVHREDRGFRQHEAGFMSVQPSHDFPGHPLDSRALDPLHNQPGRQVKPARAMLKLAQGLEAKLDIATGSKL